ncbi:MAG: hypothetical protein JO237_01145 [Pseudolabrys sp.]|nr:hypothetical protein [Pseudolabrys sp.]
MFAALMLMGAAAVQAQDAAPLPVTLGNYKQAIANAALAQLKNVTLAGALISPLVLPHLTQLGDWVACLKTANGLFLAIVDRDAVSFRRAVVIDDCERATYAPLPRPIPVHAKKGEDGAPALR